MKKLILLLCLLSPQIFAENIADINLGMTVKEVDAIATSRGFKLKLVGEGDIVNGFLTREENEYDWLANVAFCKGKVTFISKSLDFDGEYYDAVAEKITKYGNPKIKLEESDWTGPGHGKIKQVIHVWDIGKEYVELSVTPKGISSDGTLRYTRSLHIRLQAKKDACAKK